MSHISGMAKVVEAKAGRQYANHMTPAKAERFRNNLIEGHEQTPQAKREAAQAEKKKAEGKWTINRLWTEYEKTRAPGKGLATDKSRYNKYLKPEFEKKEPHEILALDVERLKRRLLKTKSPQTVKHVLNLLTWITNFGVKKNLCARV